MEQPSDLQPDIPHAREFLRRLDPTAERFTFQSIDDNADRKDWGRLKTLHGTFEELKDQLVDLNRRGAGVYVTVNLTDFRARTADNIEAVRAVFTDLDGPPLAPVRGWLRPSIVVTSSPEKFHVYYLASGVALNDFAPMQRNLAKAFGGDGSVNDLPRVLRLPGFFHQKVDAKKGLTGVPFMVRADFGTGDMPRYSAEVLARKIDEALGDTGAPTLDQIRTDTAAPALHGIKIDTGPPNWGDQDPASIAEVEEALGYIDPDLPRLDWLRVLMATKNQFGAAGEAMAQAWSEKGAKYRPGDVSRCYKGLPIDGKVKVSTLFGYAGQGGCDLSALRQKHRVASNPQPIARGAETHARAEAQDPSWDDAAATPQVSFSPAIWSDPDPRFLGNDTLPPPQLPLADVFGPVWATWIAESAEAKGAPPDYVMGALLATAGTLIGNARWVTVWSGWSEPPIIWVAAIGQPSSNKSPGLDAVLGPLGKLERAARKIMEPELVRHAAAAEVAKIAEGIWKHAVAEALKAEGEIPVKPAAAMLGPAPFPPRYVVADVTIEKLVTMIARQPRGLLLARDELAGWLKGMTRYSGGGTDRPFWLEAYGGRSYTVERIGRASVQVDRLTVGILGGIQPDRLAELLLESNDDDGLLARIVPIWPLPAAIKRPTVGVGEEFIAAALTKLLSLKMVIDEANESRPWFLSFEEEARGLMDAFRVAVREWEANAHGLLRSFLGKMPGLAARLSLVLTYLDWAASDGPEPVSIDANHFGRAAHLVEAYLLPMARRAYGEASRSKPELAARRVVALIVKNNWKSFSTRDMLRLDAAGLGAAAGLDPALNILEDANVIRPIGPPVDRRMGRPARRYEVNPAVIESAK